MVGVLVPVHGFAPYLAEALDSVLSQSPVPGAVVVIDDGSPEPLELHPDHAADCTLVRLDERSGPAGARAAGMDALSEQVDLVALCDADDAWEEGKLAAQLDAVQAHPDAVLCFGRAIVVGADGRRTGERWSEPAAGEHSGADLIAWLFEANPIPTSSVMLSREAVRAAGGFRSSVLVAEDWDLWLRLAARGGRFVCVPDALVRYRRHPGGLTADVERLARCQLQMHAAHAHLVEDGTRERVRAADEQALRSTQRHGVRRWLPRRDPYRR